ncbi:hypothetical protein [Streptomyces sp. NBC_00140]|uniref:hypothetical protein n=1 Tax=Streptomyces sp. NBC_00140 TaxID=2975664 RepID=UPI0022559B4F|nr:hypothetical protein [Streptomyces sp. NBC_00140]MCX5328633.1 hypothetical protein [Streptomyces sp. NBC_00140]
MSGPLYAELGALNAAPPWDVVARQAGHVDLIIGQCNRGTALYGTSFDTVRQHVAHAAVHELADQGHLAHLQAPAELGHLLNNLAAI